jgi:hypothetical protein
VTTRELITATGHLATAIMSLAACAPRRLAITLIAAGTRVNGAAACLAMAIGPADGTPADRAGSGQ